MKGVILVLLRISEEELLKRQKKFLEKLNNKSIDAAILFSATDIFYLTGFRFIATERPISLIFDKEGKTILYVPLLEKDYAYENAVVDNIITYPEYPGLKHPMEYFKDIIKKLNNCT